MEEQSGRFFMFRIYLMIFIIKSSVHSLEIVIRHRSLYLDCVLSKYLDRFVVTKAEITQH